MIKCGTIERRFMLARLAWKKLLLSVLIVLAATFACLYLSGFDIPSSGAFAILLSGVAFYFGSIFIAIKHKAIPTPPIGELAGPDKGPIPYWGMFIFMVTAMLFTLSLIAELASA